MDVFEQGLFYENKINEEFQNFINSTSRYTIIGAVKDLNSYYTKEELSDRNYFVNQISDDKQKEDYFKLSDEAISKFVTINDPDIKKEFLDELSQLQKQNSELLSKATTTSEKNKYRALNITYRGLVRRVKGEMNKQQLQKIITAPIPQPPIPQPPIPQPPIPQPPLPSPTKEEIQNPKNKNMLYVGLGVGALVIIALIYKKN